MKNIKQLTDRLSAVFNELDNDKIEIKKATELANIAGKIINSMKVQIVYAEMKYKGADIDIEFLNVTKSDDGLDNLIPDKLIAN